MTVGKSLWDQFIGDGVVASRQLADGLGELPSAELDPEQLQGFAHLAFTLASQSLLLGAEDVGGLALACEKCLDYVAARHVTPDLAWPLLASSTHTLAEAFQTLAHPDQSGARTEGVPLQAARYELESLFPLPGAIPPGGLDVPLVSLGKPPQEPAEPSAAPVSTPSSEEDATWVPAVDADMVEVFFEEVEERIEGLSGKLLELERRSEDADLVRDVFRDLHTVKGSSAMVGLDPMNRLAHAAEDVVGSLRDGTREADGATVDVLLAALDQMREIANQARNSEPIIADLAPLIRRLRTPGSPTEHVAITPEQTISRSKETVRQTIRVDFDKLDKLMNLVGELVLGRDGLGSAIGALSSLGGELSAERQLSRQMQIAARSLPAHSQVPRTLLANVGEELSRVERVLQQIAQELDGSSGRLDSVSAQLRDSVMKLRMIPIGGVFRKHHRTVRDLSASLDKRARLELTGEETELDKLLVEALDEPLMHLVRNSVDHGLESKEEREAAGKPAEGTISLVARHRGNQVLIEVRDDGKGIDPEFIRRRAAERDLLPREELAAMDDRDILDLMFLPGFSTAKVVSEVSGRGVGLDIVRETIVSRLKGTIAIESEPGQGTRFILQLPLTLAIIQVLLARAGGELFAIPLDAVIRTITCTPEQIELIQDREVLAVKGKQIPLVRLANVLEIGEQLRSADRMHVILTTVGGQMYGLVCENLAGKKEIVIKSLGDVLETVPCAVGATILGDRCALILDVPAIVERTLSHARRGGPISARRDLTSADTDDAPPHILLVEDSDTVRESLRRLLVDAGYLCTTARDGVEGLEIARRQLFDLVSTDIMMPRMDGYELTRELRATREYQNVPIIMVTSRDERIDRVRGFDVGVDEYITKPHDRHELLRAVAALVKKPEPKEDS